jgi:hypothetical protein
MALVDNHQDTSTRNVSREIFERQPIDNPRLRLAHGGRCGRRDHCWRPSCRSAFGIYRTVEELDDGRVIAYCHRARYVAGDLITRMVAA